jgi:hypothetical protein
MVRARVNHFNFKKWAKGPKYYWSTQVTGQRTYITQQTIMDDEFGFIERSSRFRRVDYREVLPSGNKRFKNNEVLTTQPTPDKNVTTTTTDIDWVQDTRNEKQEKSKKAKKKETDKKVVGKTKSSSSKGKGKVVVVKDSDDEDYNDDEEDDDDDEIESVDEGEDFADLVKQFKARGAASKIRSKGVSLEEINDAKLTALQELARFKRSLEPFLTEKGTLAKCICK